MIVILGIRISNRLGAVTEVQEVLTEYGCAIKTRLGLHDLSDNECKNSGLILLELRDEEKSIELKARLEKIENIDVKEMKF